MSSSMILLAAIRSIYLINDPARQPQAQAPGSAPMGLPRLVCAPKGRHGGGSFHPAWLSERAAPLGPVWGPPAHTPASFTRAHLLHPAEGSGTHALCRADRQHTFRPCTRLPGRGGGVQGLPEGSTATKGWCRAGDTWLSDGCCLMNEFGETAVLPGWVFSKTVPKPAVVD